MFLHRELVTHNLVDGAHMSNLITGPISLLSIVLTPPSIRIVLVATDHPHIVALDDGLVM